MDHTALGRRIQRLDQLYLAADAALTLSHRNTDPERKGPLRRRALRLWAAYRKLRDAWPPKQPETRLDVLREEEGRLLAVLHAKIGTIRPTRAHVLRLQQVRREMLDLSNPLPIFDSPAIVG